VVDPVESSHRRRVLSHEADSAYAPSEEMTYTVSGSVRYIIWILLA
jgi:hypothetical protein